MTQELIDAIVEMREEDALKITHDLLAKGTDPFDILAACRKSMEVVGDRFEAGEFFVPELILAGEMMTQISEAIKPLLKSDAPQTKLGKVVFGTVQGDIHDIGKDIVVFMLDINGFEVIDLGVDVAPERFVSAVNETGADVVGLSGFLTLAYDPMKETVEALRESGRNLRIMIGGGQIDDRIRQYTGADAYGKDAMAAVRLAKEWLGA
jgi:methanogenic corrinoid protein MtbC1